MKDETREQGPGRDGEDLTGTRRGILFVEDSDEDCEFAAQRLREQGYCCARMRRLRARDVEGEGTCLPPTLVQLVATDGLDRYADQTAAGQDAEARRLEDAEVAGRLRDRLEELATPQAQSETFYSDAPAEIARQFRAFAGAVVDVMFRTNPLSPTSPDAPEIVVFFRRLRMATGAAFRICVWTRFLSKAEGTAPPSLHPEARPGNYADRIIVKGWGADCCVSKSWPELGASLIRKCMETPLFGMGGGA